MEKIQKLDNPVWYSLTETHHNHALNHDNIKFYRPEYAPFGAIKFDENNIEAIREYSELIETFLIVGNKPKLPEYITLTNELVGLQMINYNEIDLPITKNITKLDSSHLNEVQELVKLVYL